MTKRFIICCDGTWQTADEGDPGVPSNVAKFSRMLAKGCKPGEGGDIEQVVYYQSGIGTGALSALDRLIGGAFGAGLEENMIKAYHFIATNYEEGDEICLFGFSRGAYTARALGWCLTSMGILMPEDLGYFAELYKIFKKVKGDLVFSDTSPYPELHGWSRGTGKNGNMVSLDDAEKVAIVTSGTGDFIPRKRMKTQPKPTDIKVVGVWDTVGELGLPDSIFTKLAGVHKKYEFYDTSLNDRIKFAFQALALDEHRGAFGPSLWYLEAGDKTDLRQCWFPGYHGDCGGGALSPLGPNRLLQSDYSLAWMCDQVDGLVDFSPTASSQILREVKPHATYKIGTTLDPCGLLYQLEIAGGSRMRTPGAYHKDLREDPPNLAVNKTTRERMHPTVLLRIDSDAKYRPRALAKHHTWFSYTIPAWEYSDGLNTGDGSVWTRPAISRKCQKIELQEHVIREQPGKHNFETKLLPDTILDHLRKKNLKKLTMPTSSY